MKQGARDHIDRLQAEVQTLEANLVQAKGALARSNSSAQAELSRMRTELAGCESAVTHLRQQLEAQQAEVVMLEESQGSSNKASDVIRALEKQVYTTC